VHAIANTGTVSRHPEHGIFGLIKGFSAGREIAATYAQSFPEKEFEKILFEFGTLWLFAAGQTQGSSHFEFFMQLTKYRMPRLYFAESGALDCLATKAANPGAGQALWHNAGLKGFKNQFCGQTHNFLLPESAIKICML
jgi:hypothetical protein